MSFGDDHKLETYKSLVTYGLTGLKFVLAVNGGAAIAIMTFLGHLLANGRTDIPDLRAPLIMFLIGVVVGGVAILTTYFTQLRLFNESFGRQMKGPTSDVWLYHSIALLIVGLALFGVGSILAVWRMQ